MPRPAGVFNASQSVLYLTHSYIPENRSSSSVRHARRAICSIRFSLCCCSDSKSPESRRYCVAQSSADVSDPATKKHSVCLSFGASSSSKSIRPLTPCPVVISGPQSSPDAVCAGLVPHPNITCQGRPSVSAWNTASSDCSVTVSCPLSGAPRKRALQAGRRSVRANQVNETCRSCAPELYSSYRSTTPAALSGASWCRSICTVVWPRPCR